MKLTQEQFEAKLRSKYAAELRAKRDSETNSFAEGFADGCAFTIEQVAKMLGIDLTQEAKPEPKSESPWISPSEKPAMWVEVIPAYAQFCQKERRGVGWWTGERWQVAWIGATECIEVLCWMPIPPLEKGKE